MTRVCAETRRRISDVIGARLERQSQQADRPPGRAAHRRQDALGEPILGRQVGRGRGCRDVHRQPEGTAGHGQCRELLGKAAATETEARLHVGSADPRIGAYPGKDVVDVGASLLAQRSDLVRERQLEREERIGAVLDDLGRLDIDDEAWSVDPVVERDDRRERFGIGIGEAADDDAARVGEVFDGSALSQELGVGEHARRRQPGSLDRRPRPTDGQRAADDQDVVGPDPFAESGHRGVELPQIARAVIADGGPDAHQDDPRLVGHSRADGQSSIGHGRIECFLEACLVDRDPARAERLEPDVAGLDDVDVLAEPGEPDRRHESDIARADDGDGTLWAGRHREKAYQSGRYTRATTDRRT